MTPFKTHAPIRGLEAVPARGSIGPVILAALLLASGSAAATAPLPSYTVWVAPDDVDREIWEEQVYYKREFGPFCVRTLLCVGPYEPWYEWDFGKTGARLATEDVNLTAEHNASRKARYGPYAAPTLVSDDLRVCYDGCTLPDSLRLAARGNVTLEVFVLGSTYGHTVRLNESVESVHPAALPRSWCRFAIYSQC